MYVAAAMCVLLFSFSACTENTAIGGEILEGDLQNTQFRDDFSLTANTVRGDSLRVFPFPIVASTQLPEYLLGRYEDPIFGRVESSIYAQVSFTGAPPDFSAPNDTTAYFLDSVVLVLPYLNTADYGDTDGEFTTEVYRITEDVVIEQSLYSDKTYEIGAMPLGSVTTTVDNTNADSINLEVPRNDTLGFNTVLSAPQLRIPLDNAFGTEIFTGADEFFDAENPANFKDLLKGLHVRTEGIDEGLFSVALRDNTNAGLFFYYRRNVNGEDVTNSSYRFQFKADDLKLTNYVTDHTGSIVADYLTDGNDDDDLLFVQGLSGVNGKIILPNLDELNGNIIVNKAELVLTVANLPEDGNVYALPGQLRLETVDELGNFFSIEDYGSALVSGALSRFGGTPEVLTVDETIYTMNITAHIQNYLRGNVTDEMRLTVADQRRFANRAVFYGTASEQSPPQLRIYYTEIE